MLFLRVLFSSCFLLCVACGDDGESTPPEADAAANAADAMPALPYLSSCDVTNDQCDSSMDLFCFAFNNKGPTCTHSCSGDLECEAPSPGCGNMGVCKQQ